MKNKIPILLTLLILSISGCSAKWTEAIRSGGIAQKQFTEAVNFEVQNGLILAPVTIAGKTYRFLFDTGAPFSISEQLQQELNFPIVSESNIVDSDKNSQKVEWARVNAIQIGNITFEDQTAFIGDFDANPLLKCIGIDGIIGSNLMRHCNWTIDPRENTLTLSSEINEELTQEAIAVPFTPNKQFSMYIDLPIGSATVRNILVDYGSNGTVSLGNDIFGTIKSRNIIDKTLVETGAKQSGIVGSAVSINREFTYSDSVHFGDVYLKHAMIRTNSTTSIGNGLLSRFKVTIDWEKNRLLLNAPQINTDRTLLSGFRLGYTNAKGIHIQSVVEGTNAYEQGIRPDMKVIKLDDLDFENGSDFCDYASHETGEKISLEVLDLEGNSKRFQIQKASFK